MCLYQLASGEGGCGLCCGRPHIVQSSRQPVSSFLLGTWLFSVKLGMGMQPLPSTHSQFPQNFRGFPWATILQKPSDS